MTNQDQPKGQAELTERKFKCDKCNDGIITLTHKDVEDGLRVTVSPCSNKSCKYQYYLKGLFDAKLTEIEPKSNHVEEQPKEGQPFNIRVSVENNESAIKFYNSKGVEIELPLWFKQQICAPNSEERETGWISVEEHDEKMKKLLRFAMQDYFTDVALSNIYEQFKAATPTR